MTFYTTPHQFPFVDTPSTWSSSSLPSIYASSSSSSTSSRKQVRIVSPIKWNAYDNSVYHRERKREFINSTISYCDIKQLLRTQRLSTRGSYQQCVNRLLESNWVPHQKYIEQNERLRAKPVQNRNLRTVLIECDDSKYLSNFSINELKKWLKAKHIKQPLGQKKAKYIQLIQKHYPFRSPSPESLISRKPPNKAQSFASNANKRMSRTPRRCFDAMQGEDDEKVNAFNGCGCECDVYDADEVGDNEMNVYEESDENSSVRLQLHFDD